MKKFVSLLLTAVLLATMLTVFAVPASADRNRTFGANAAYIGKWAVFSNSETEDIHAKDSTTFYYILGVNGLSYDVASYQQYSFGWGKSEENKDCAFFLYLVPTESIPAEVRAMAENDYPNLSPTGSTLSEGSLTIIVGIAAAVVFGLGGFFVGKAAGKKKKPALVNGADNSNEE